MHNVVCQLRKQWGHYIIWNYYTICTSCTSKVCAVLACVLGISSTRHETASMSKTGRQQLVACADIIQWNSTVKHDGTSVGHNPVSTMHCLTGWRSTKRSGLPLQGTHLTTDDVSFIPMHRISCTRKHFDSRPLHAIQLHMYQRRIHHWNHPNGSTIWAVSSHANPWGWMSTGTSEQGQFQHVQTYAV